jgi:hypothetical protein
LLHRILHRYCTGFCTAFGCQLEVIVANLQVVLLSDASRVPEPLANHVDWVPLSEFRLAGCTQVVEEFRPGFHAGLLNNPQELRPKVRVGISITVDDITAPWFGQVECFGQVGTKFSEDRHPSAFMSFMVLGLWTPNPEAIALPAHVGSLQGQVFRRTAQATVPALGE